MNTPESHKPVMEFVFQSIKLEQVKDLIPTSYRSKYEAIRNQVIQRIQSMPEGETFLFQPLDRKTKLDDNLIARICHGINTGLVREDLNWKISFSKKASAFVVAPYQRNKHGKRHEPKAVKPTLPKAPSDNDRGSITDQEAAHLTHLLKLTHQHLGKNLKDLQTKLRPYSNPELANVKKAFAYVGHNAMGVKLAHIGKLLGLQSASTTTMCQRAMKDPQAKEYVKVLSSAITQNGGGAKS